MLLHSICATGGTPPVSDQDISLSKRRIDESAKSESEFDRMSVEPTQGRASPLGRFVALRQLAILRVSSNQRTTTNVLHGSPATFLPKMPWTGLPSFYHPFPFSLNYIYWS